MACKLSLLTETRMVENGVKRNLSICKSLARELLNMYTEASLVYAPVHHWGGRKQLVLPREGEQVQHPWDLGRSEEKWTTQGKSCPQPIRGENSVTFNLFMPAVQKIVPTILPISSWPVYFSEDIWRRNVDQNLTNDSPSNILWNYSWFLIQQISWPFKQYFFDQCIFQKKFDREVLFKTLQIILLQIFCEIMVRSSFILKSITDPGNTHQDIQPSRHKWVNPLVPRTHKKVRSEFKRCNVYEIVCLIGLSS